MMTAHSPQTVTTIPQMNPKVQLVTSAFGVDQQWQINNLIGLEPDRWQSEERLIRARKPVIQWRMLVTRLKDQQEKKRKYRWS